MASFRRVPAARASPRLAHGRGQGFGSPGQVPPEPRTSSQLEFGSAGQLLLSPAGGIRRAGFKFLIMRWISRFGFVSYSSVALFEPLCLRFDRPALERGTARALMRNFNAT
jgi:hypothetical protein